MADNRFAQTFSPGPGAPTTEGFLLAQTWMNSVVVPATQNLLGGLGVFVLTLIGGIMADLNLTMAAKIAGISAGVVFGIAMILRAFRDEVRFVITVWSEHQDQTTQASLQHEINALNAEIERKIGRAHV